MAWYSFLGAPLIDSVNGLAKTVGNGAGSFMDRVGWTEKLSEGAKWDKLIEASEVAFKDVTSARQMFMAEMGTQKHSWLVRQLNGSFRFVAGYVSVAYLFESFLGQAYNQIAGGTWIITNHDPVTDLCATSIIGFFFYLRQRSKENSVTDIS